MTNIKRVSPIYCGLSILAFALIVSGCGKDESKETISKQVPNVRVQLVKPGSISETLKLTGEVKPFSTVVITPQVPGRLERLAAPDGHGGYEPISEGTHVHKGMELAVIDHAVYRARLDQAKAAEAMAEAQCDDAKKEEKRIVSLFKEGAATEQMRDKTITGRSVAEAALQQAKALLELAEISFDESTPSSPIDGMVIKKHVDEGNIVSPGMPLLTIENSSKVKIVFSISERYLTRVVEGKTNVRISSDALSDVSIDAVVSKLYPAVDPATRTGTAEVLLDNVNGHFRTGNFVDVSLDVANVDGAVVIPLSAIVWQGQEAFIFVVEGGKAHRRAVRVGIREQERCQIVNGLQPNEMLVLEGFRNLLDGDEVALQERGR